METTPPLWVLTVLVIIMFGLLIGFLWYTEDIKNRASAVSSEQYATMYVEQSYYYQIHGVNGSIVKTIVKPITLDDYNYTLVTFQYDSDVGRVEAEYLVTRINELGSSRTYPRLSKESIRLLNITSTIIK